MLNLDGVDTDINQSNSDNVLTATTLRVGDRVGFKKDGEDIVGIVKRVNQKSVTLVTEQGGQWRVSYSCLYLVYEAEQTTCAISPV